MECRGIGRRFSLPTTGGEAATFGWESRLVLEIFWPQSKEQSGNNRQVRGGCPMSASGFSPARHAVSPVAAIGFEARSSGVRDPHSLTSGDRLGMDAECHARAERLGRLG